MAFGEDIGGRLCSFERLLEALDEEDPPDPEIGFARLWPRSFASLTTVFHSGDTVESLYVEALAPEHAPAPEKPGKTDLTANFADIRKELTRPRSLAELRQLRRRCALLVHPDRVAPLQRSLAENFMAEVNAAIDHAIKGKTTVTQTP